MPHVARETLPLIARHDARLVLASMWTAGTPEAQHSAADAALDWWRQEQLPAGALTHTCLLGHDNRTIFHYSQWADEHGPEEFLAVGMAERFNAIGCSVPGASPMPQRNTACIEALPAAILLPQAA